MSEELTEIGKYKVVERIGTRGRGRVYKVADPDSGREMTLRMMAAELATDDESVERFEREVEAAAKVEHRNVARILGHGLENGRLYYVTELVETPTLRRTLKRRRLSLQEVFLVFKQVARAVAAIHAQGIVHRDLNPRSILVSENFGSVKLTGFGITRSVVSSATLTSTASVTGSFHYISPEAAADGGDADERSDIYSLGALFYEMLVGKVPSGKFNLPSRADSNVPDALDPVVLKCLEANPANRYSSVELLLREIEQLEDRLGLGLVSELKGISRSFAKPARGFLEHRGLMIGISAVIAVAAVGFFLWKRSVPVSPSLQSTPPPVAMPAAPSAAEVVDALDEIPDSAESGEEGDPAGTVEDAPVEAATEPEVAAPAPAVSRPPVSQGPDLTMALEIAGDKARNGLLDQALSDIVPLVASGVDSAIVSDALFLRARIEEAQKRFDDAQATYTEIQTRFDDPPIQARAGYRFGRAAIDSGEASRHAAALRVFQEVARLYPQTEYAPRALAAVAAMQSAAKTQTEDAEFGKRVPTAFVTSRELIARYPDDEAAERAYWLVGETFNDLKLFQEAVGAFSELAARFPETELDAWWRIGQLYDRRLDDKARAIDAYRHVPESSEHHGDAQKRINRLSR